MYSINGAYALGKEGQFETIASGKDADLVVLSQNLSSTPAEKWTERVDVEITLANGNIIYQKSD